MLMRCARARQGACWRDSPRPREKWLRPRAWRDPWRSPSHPLFAAQRIEREGELQVGRAALRRSSPIGPRLWRREALLDGAQDRSDRRGEPALAADARHRAPRTIERTTNRLTSQVPPVDERRVTASSMIFRPKISAECNARSYARAAAACAGGPVPEYGTSWNAGDSARWLANDGGIPRQEPYTIHGTADRLRAAAG